MTINGISVDPMERYYITVSRRAEVGGMTFHPRRGVGYGVDGGVVEQLGEDAIATIAVDATRVTDS